MRQALFTIGHSNHALGDFLALLSMHAITAVCDVRSAPFSRFSPQFNRDDIGKVLQDRGIAYLFLGRELGARSEDPGSYEEGKVQYGRLAGSALFQQGLTRIEDGLGKGFRIAVMCAEKEPIECHRTILVGRQLETRGIDVQHILASGEIESHAAAMRRLARLVKVPENDLFRSAEELLAETYQRAEDRIAYEIEQTPAYRVAVG
jgi:uncharacterized protein (DUF488 family)